MDIRTYLKSKKILADGAFGTYYTQKYETGNLPERGNITAPELVRKIHLEYLEAGSRLIRTNTFASNRQMLHCDKKGLAENVSAACEIAKSAVALFRTNHPELDDDVYIAGSIGPIPFRRGRTATKIRNEYEIILNTMWDAGIRCFVFETFAEIDMILPAIHNFRLRHTNTDITGSKDYTEPFILVQLCMNQHGYTNNGYYAETLIKKLQANPDIDACGFNCGIGPSGMANLIDSMDLSEVTCLSVLPNAGFPGNMADRTVFNNNSVYFAGTMSGIAEKGADIIGGCCGTTPEFIRIMSETCDLTQTGHHFAAPRVKGEATERKKDSAFWKSAAVRNENRLLAVELAPPFGADDRKLMNAANLLTGLGINAVTLPDSPSGRTRADSVLMGVKIQNETTIPAVPHLCCRDKNVIGLRSEILGAYMNGIRNLLVITGDPVPTKMRQAAKSVFNFDSIGLMQIIEEMNKDEFAEDPITIGGALSYARRNINIEMSRMEKKIACGCSFFLTQPVFDPEDIEKLRQFKTRMKWANPDAKLLVGVMPLVSRKNALFIENEIAGIRIPDSFINLYSEDMSRAEGEAVGVEIVRNVIKQSADFADGYYFSIPFNRVYLLEQIIAD